MLDVIDMPRVMSYMGYPADEERLRSVINKVDADGSGDFDLVEFRMLMRVYFEDCVENFKAEFDSIDVDGSGSMNTRELFIAVKRLGYYPTDESVEEAIQLYDKDHSGEISFDELAQLMVHLRRTSGFTKEEIAHATDVFQHFDRDDSGELNILELGPCLRHLGDPTSMNLLQRMLTHVDADGSGEVDLAEWLKLLRRYRNRELQQCEDLFRQFAVLCVPQEDLKDEIPMVKDVPLYELFGGLAGKLYVIRQDFLPEVIAAVGWPENDRLLRIARGGESYGSLKKRGDLRFNEFVDFVNIYRGLERNEFKERAGFTPEEASDYEDTFAKYDKSGDGTLDIKELLPLLTAVGRAPKNLIEQQELTRALQDYVQKPDEPEGGGGGEDDEEEEEQQGEIDFMGFLQLMRRFLDDSDAQMLRKEEEAIARTGFAPDEVTQWRDIFVKFDV